MSEGGGGFWGGGGGFGGGGRGEMGMGRYGCVGCCLWRYERWFLGGGQGGTEVELIWCHEG